MVSRRSSKKYSLQATNPSCRISGSAQTGYFVDDLRRRPNDSRQPKYWSGFWATPNCLGNAQLDVPAAELSLSQRQAVSIARSLVRRPRVLILDEATAALDVQTRDRLFNEIRRLTAQGSAVLFISHRMDEVAEISDRVTVLRSGQTISTVAKETMTISGLIQDMTGSKASPEESFKPPREPGKVVLQARDIQLAEQATKIN